jgi:hypothetical protein
VVNDAGVGMDAVGGSPDPANAFSKWS